MSIPWDADILIFALTTAKIVIGGKKRLRESKRAIAVHDQLQAIREDSLTKLQKDYIRPFEEQLARLNYFPDFTYCVTNHRNYGRNLIRRYTNPTDPASCTLMIVELKVNVGDVESTTTSSNVAFRTRFASGKHLTTRNMSRKSLMDHPPDSIIQECRHTTNLAELKRQHEARAAELGPALPLSSGPEAIMEEHHTEHERFCEYQLERGVLQLLPDGEAYEVTDKTRARGIWNHYNPFAKRLSLKELLLAALIGSFLPLFGILKLAPLVTGRLQGTGPSLLPLAWLAIGVCYALAGFTIGIISDRASFQWIMLICYVPAHFIAGWSFGAAPYSTMAFLISFYVIRIKRRRALIFQS